MNRSVKYNQGIRDTSLSPAAHAMAASALRRSLAKPNDSKDS